MSDNEAKKPVISIRLVGEGIKPEAIPFNRMNELVSAIQTLAETDMRLVNVRRTSAAYLLYTSYPSSLLAKLRDCGEALRDPGLMLESRMLSSFDTLTSILDKFKCRLRVSAIDKSWAWSLRTEQWPAIRDKFLIEDSAEIYGEIKRVGGATRMKCALRVPYQKELVYCDLVNDDIARRMGQMLYQNVTVRGRGTFFIRDWKMVRFSIHDFQSHEFKPFEQLYKDMREAGGRTWDSISNPNEFLREIR